MCVCACRGGGKGCVRWTGRTINSTHVMSVTKENIKKKKKKKPPKFKGNKNLRLFKRQNFKYLCQRDPFPLSHSCYKKKLLSQC